jgi:hypothetical protein
MIKIELENTDKGLNIIQDAIRKIQEFNRLSMLYTKYNDSIVINIITSIKNQKDLNNFIFAIKGIDSVYSTYTRIFELSEYGERIKILK